VSLDRFILEQQYQKVKGLGDRLELMKHQIDWKPFIPLVKSVFRDNKTVGGCPRPTVRILRPENALYLFNIKLKTLSSQPIIIGRIKITVEAYQEEVGIDHVSFYIDSSYKYSDYEAPYEWVWKERSFFFYDIGVWAESKDGKSSEASIHNVLKIF